MSIRTKQALILLFATVLPFALGASAVAFFVAPAYRQIVTQAQGDRTARLADRFAFSFARTLSRLDEIATREEVRDAVQPYPIPPEEAEALRREWNDLPPDHPAFAPVLDSRLALLLRVRQELVGSVVLLVITDARGDLVAASRKPAVFNLAHEDWWQGSYAGGAGMTYLSEPVFEPEAETWITTAAIPIRAEPLPGAPVSGILAVTLDLRALFHEVHRPPPDRPPDDFLVDGDGRVLAPAEAPPDALPNRVARRLPTAPTGTLFVTRDMREELYTWARVPVARALDPAPAAEPTLSIVSWRDAAEAFAPLRAVNRTMLLIGALTILAAVLIGYWLAEVLVVRHIRLLAHGMNELARGDFERAGVIADQLVGNIDGEEEAPARPNAPNARQE